MKKATPWQRLQYQFDNSMSKGAVALIGYLALLSALIIVVASLFVLLTQSAPDLDSGEKPGLVRLFWMGLMRTLDAGTMGGDTGSWPFLFAMFAVTLGGVFIVSTLIGVLSSAIESKLADLRKGRSLVVEEDHTVILGWSDQVIPIISELAVANANRKRPCVAVLAAKDKVEMEDEIRAKVGRLGNTRIVCRTGDPMDPSNLAIINTDTARSMIVIAPPSNDPDASVIKVLLALTNNPRRRPQPYHIVAEVQDPRNEEVARMVGKDEAVLIMAHELIARITAQTCRQSGLSVVYTGLLDFDGDEIYMKEEPALVGKTFAEALSCFEDSTVIGLVVRDGTTLLKPPFEREIVAWDKVIAISRDDDTITCKGTSGGEVDEAALAQPSPRPAQPERTLILGWNKRAPSIVSQIDSYVAPGSEVMVAADGANDDALAKRCAVISNQRCRFENADTTDRRVLDDLNIPSYQHVIVLSYSDTLDAQQADAKTLITLLHLRDIADKTGASFSIVSEMMDTHNRELAEVTRADDFVVSNRLISLMMAQVSENKALAPVFGDLFDPEGVEVYLRPAGDYVLPGQPVSFYTVLEAARRRDEIAIGYRLHAEASDVAASHGVHINPNKSEKVAYSAQDRIIVLADS